MAVTNFDGYDTGHAGAYASDGYRYAEGRHASPGRTQRMVNLAGAAVSVGLIAGAAWWGYKIAVRDVSGVPVVRALEGPLRISPDNPGGERADHQGLAVNSVAAVGTAAPVADELVLAPRPVDLTLEDGPGLAAEAPVIAEGTLDTTPQPLPAAAAPAEAAAEPVEAAIADGPEVLLQAALTEALDQPAPAAEAAVLESDPALAGMRPMPRPSAGPDSDAPMPEPVAIADTAADVPEAAEIDPAGLEVGTWLVQLGAFDDVEGARAHWIERASVFPDQMTGKARIVQEGAMGGQTFIRLRVQGFENKAAAHDFCTAMIEKDLTCIPVIVE